jgi:hypothetical protein
VWGLALVEAIFEKLLTVLLSGGPQAIISILLGIIVLLLLDRRRLTAEVARKDEKIEKIVEDYNKGNMTISQALAALREVLIEIKGKL